MSHAAPEPTDVAQRRRALDPCTSFIVQAPAGSGKTELLIQRFLALLATVERPEEIAAITFTRKAASEMKRRIVEALRAAAAPTPPQDAHRAITWRLARQARARDVEGGWGLDENPARLRIQTIDALCASLTRQMPVVSSFGAQPESIDDASALYAIAARNTLAAVADARDPACEDAARLLAHVDNNAAHAEALLADLLRRRDHWIRSLAQTFDRAKCEQVLGAVRLEAIARAVELMPPGHGLVLPGPHDADGWRAFACECLLSDGSSWKAKGPSLALKPNEPLRMALATVQALPPGAYDDSQWKALGAIARVLPRALAELKLAFAAEGRADFVEIAQAALRALGTDDAPTDLLLALDYRIRHLLVDEFQDTSFTQRELLEKLTSGWQPGDGRTLFVVGDPMQSIYRFREAEVALFLRARREGIGAVALEPLTLATNFRSRAGIVDWVNATFSRVMPQREEVNAGAVRYEPSVAMHPHEPGDAVTVHAFEEGDAAGEAACVARVAAQAQREDGSVAILVRNRKHLEAIIPALRAANLAFRAIEIEPLGHRPVVQDLLSLARALSHPADRIAWLAVLRSPPVGLTLADLEALAGADPAVIIWERMGDQSVAAMLSPDGRQRLRRAQGVLAKAMERRGRGSLREAVESAWMALQGPACFARATDLADADAFLDHLESAEHAGALPSVADFEAGLAKLFALPDVDAPERLQVMTIYKAKGLEFDTVIVPGLSAPAGREGRKLFIWMETDRGLLVAPVNPSGSDADRIYEFIRRLDRDKADHESGRLLYVAATRARRRLHLMGACKRGEDGAVREPARNVLLAKLWPAVQQHFRRPAPVAASPRALGPVAASRAEELLRLAQPVQVDVPAAVTWNAPPPADAPREPIEFSWAGEAARRVGSVVHRWLQRIADDRLDGWDADRLGSLRAAIVNDLATRGIAPAEMERAADRALEALRACLDDPRGRWLLGPQRDARNEYRLSAVVEGRRRHLVIDRLFADESGRAWIVDYKTSSHEGGQLEAFLDQERRRYRGQLEGYAGVLPRTGSGVTLGLYFPLLRGWREWEAGAEEPPPKE